MLRSIAFCVVFALLLSGCGGGHLEAARRTGSPIPSSPPTRVLPALPIESAGGGPGQPPIVWVGGTLVDVAENQIVVQEELGSVVTLKRLGQGATAFYRASSSGWERLPDRTRFGRGERACVETALDGTNLLALRVFLGAACGPAA